jgi:hypothetical protein
MIKKLSKALLLLFGKAVRDSHGSLLCSAPVPSQVLLIALSAALGPTAAQLVRGSMLHRVACLRKLCTKFTQSIHRFTQLKLFHRFPKLYLTHCFQI